MTNIGGAAPGAVTVRMYTPGLTSKWGFEDGDLFFADARVQVVLDQVHRMTARRIGARDLLVAVVREVVLAQLDQRVELNELVTLHNPARAARVDGVRLDSYGNPPDGHEPVEITPDIVEVSLLQIRAVALRLARAVSP